MSEKDCLELRARADMLHEEAEHGRAKALARGVAWEGYAEQMMIADRVEALAREIRAQIGKTCKISHTD